MTKTTVQCSRCLSNSRAQGCTFRFVKRITRIENGWIDDLSSSGWRVDLVDYHYRCLVSPARVVTASTSVSNSESLV